MAKHCAPLEIQAVQCATEVKTLFQYVPAQTAPMSKNARRILSWPAILRIGSAEQEKRREENDLDKCRGEKVFQRAHTRTHEHAYRHLPTHTHTHTHTHVRPRKHALRGSPAYDIAWPRAQSRVNYLAKPVR